MDRCKWCSLALGWFTLVAVGFYALTQYELQPGMAARLPENRLADTEFSRSDHRWSLVAFMHPRCPCSRAAVSELTRLVEHSQLPLDVRILFYTPAGESEAWARTDLWHEAALIPGAQLLIDVDGREAKRFDAATSGQTFLYAPDGRLAFAGGLTASRGHYGANPASDRLGGLLSDPHSSGQAATPVFGCPLSDALQSTTEAN